MQIIIFLLLKRFLFADSPADLEKGFLTPTYGLLNRRDTDFAFQLSSKKGGKYLKNGVNRPWQCFESNKVFYSCHSIEEEKIGWWVHIEIEGEKIKHEYVFKTGWGKDYCLETVDGMTKLRKGNSHMCFSGTYLDLSGRENDGREVELWEFMQVKSKSGSQCWFREDDYGCTGQTVLIKKQSKLKF